LGTSTGISYVLPGSGWYVLASDAIAPAGATQAAFEIVATASAVSSVLHVDQVALWQVLPLTEVETVDGGGYIKLTLRELTLDYELVVSRVSSDGSRTLVRGTSGLIDHQVITSDLMVIEDHEAPLNTPVYYIIEQYPPGSLVSNGRVSDSVTLALADINLAWLKDPSNPQRNCLVMVAKAPDWQRPVDQAAYIVKGRRNKVTLNGKRLGLEGDLAIATRSDGERAALNLRLDDGNTLLWQAVPGMGVSDMYVSAGQSTEARTGGLAQDVWRNWTLPLVEADMPVTAGVNGAAGRTCQDVVTEFDTCADLLAAYRTCEDLLLDRRR
jgi:hypothetical protein